ncbi:MAG: hypothetical protein LBD93_02995 [Treponema sp.]|nr:hypothetical protein [Treponema sp.]
MRHKPCFAISGRFFFLLLYPFWGCTPEINGGLDDYTAIKVVQVIPKELQRTEDLNPAAVSVANGANDFAFQLSAALAAQKGTTNNLVCSPLSVWIPLTALVNAVKVQYKADLLRALCVPDLEDADINNGVSRMLYDLTRQRYKEYEEMYGQGNYHDPIKIANAIFVDYDLKIENDFAQAFMDYYRGSSIHVDFESPTAVTEVNDWVDKNTNGMIQNIIPEFEPETLVVLANAVYFFDRWSWEFDPNKTKPDTFYAPGGRKTQAFYMLREGERQIYFEDEKLQAIPLSFKTDSGLYILLPKDGNATGLLASLTSDYFLAIQNGSKLADGKLLLPRFSIDGDVMRLKDILITMGIPLFEHNSLTGLIQEADVFLRDAIHKAVIQVDEKGTTAAAVTILEGATSSGENPPREQFEMICDKPFVFILYGRTTDGGNQVLFTGVVNQP